MSRDPKASWARRGDEPLLSDLGEVEILRRIRERLEAIHDGDAPSFLPVGPGDDAAVYSPGKRSLVLTCDIHVEGEHFRTDLLTPREAGRRVMVSNISDVAAMGADPRAALISLALPAYETVRALFEILGGMADEIGRWGGAVAGGNLSRTAGPRVMDVSLVGETGKPALLRSGARAGDDLVLVGETGASAAGLWCLESGGARPALAERYTSPRHRLEESRRLRDHAGVRALIDTSDGFHSDLSRLCEASGVRAEVELARLPQPAELSAAAKRAGRDPLEWILGPSDDYALLAAVDPSATDQVVASLGDVARRVGRFVEGSGIALNGEAAGKWTGWDHFRRES